MNVTPAFIDFGLSSNVPYRVFGDSSGVPYVEYNAFLRGENRVSHELEGGSLMRGGTLNPPASKVSVFGSGVLTPPASKVSVFDQGRLVGKKGGLRRGGLRTGRGAITTLKSGGYLAF